MLHREIFVLPTSENIEGKYHHAKIIHFTLWPSCAGLRTGFNGDWGGMYFSSIVSALPAGLSDWRHNRIIVFITLGVIIFLPLTYLIAKGFFDRSDTVDFKYFWLAGHVWGHGIDPYTSAYQEIGEKLFIGRNRPPMFFYPPSWYFPTRLMAMVPYEYAMLLWRGISAILIIFAMKIWLNIYQSTGFRLKLSTASIFFYSAFASASTGMAISMGQTSPLIFFAMTLFFKARLENSRPVMIVALCLLMLKPNVGLLFCAVLIPSLFWWPALVAAAIISIAGSLPALIPFGVVQTLSKVALDMGQYDAYSVNGPMSTTGLRNLLFYIFGINTSAFVLALSSYIAAFGVAATGFSRTKRLKVQGTGRLFSEFCLYIALTASVMSLHTYDLIILAPIALLCSFSNWKIAAGVSACLLILIRGNNIAAWLGLMEGRTVYFQESAFYTFFLTIIAGLVLVGWLQSLRAENLEA